MANEKFWLIFPDEPTTKYDINEPIGFGDVDFNLDRKEGGHALDVSLSGGKVPFRFTLYRHDGAFQKLLYFNELKGFETSILLGIQLENGDIFIGELDYYTAKTNDYDYFECSVILQSELQIFKRRSETKVDLFSNKDINGNYIDPLVPTNMLLQAKPSVFKSEWKQGSPFLKTFVSYGLDSAQYSIVDSIVGTSGINDTLIPYAPYQQSSLTTSISNFEVYNPLRILENQDNLNDIKISIKGLSVYVADGPAQVSTRKYLRIVYSKTFENGTITYLNIIPSTLSNIDINNQDYTFTIPKVERGTKFIVLVEVNSRVTTPSGTPVGTTTIDVNFSGGLTFSVESVAYNSVFPTFRLIDVMRQVSKSISGLGIYAPRYDVGGEFYDTVLANGRLLGGITNKPVYVSWEDIEKSIIGEHNADSEIQIDKQIFVGIEEDYYTNEECGFFDNTQFSGLSKVPNPEYCLNEFSLGYNKYQSKKEATEPNSESTIHGESKLTPYNQKVENKKELRIEWERDAIGLDVQQRLSTKVTEDTATQDDDTIFAIDTIETVDDQKFTETTNLQQTFLGSQQLSLRSNGEVNFFVLGIRIGTVFTVEAPDANNGNYTVDSVFESEIKLMRTSPGIIGSVGDGVRLTKYTYEIKKATIPLTNRTNQGFSAVLNLVSPEKYSNLRFSVERNIRNYWNSFLATVNLYWADKPIINTFYKNNSECETEYNGLRIVEKEDFIPTNPIVTPFMYEDVIFANVEFSDFRLLQDQLRTRRGFIRTIDNNRRVLRLYPLKMSYENKSRQLTIIGKEKFEKSYLDIVRAGSIITINGETKLLKLKYSIDEGSKIVLYDMEDEKLYNGIIWNKVSINGAIAPTLNILKNWLDLL